MVFGSWLVCVLGYFVISYCFCDFVLLLFGLMGLYWSFVISFGLVLWLVVDLFSVFWLLVDFGLLG